MPVRVEAFDPVVVTSPSQRLSEPAADWIKTYYNFPQRPRRLCGEALCSCFLHLAGQHGPGGSGQYKGCSSLDCVPNEKRDHTDHQGLCP